MGRHLWIDLPEATTHGYSFVIANELLYLIGTTNGETGVADNQGGQDIFLAKIITGLEDAEVPFSGISITPTAPLDSQGNLHTSEDGSSTSFKIRLNQIPITDEEVEVALTGLAIFGSDAPLPDNRTSEECRRLPSNKPKTLPLSLQLAIEAEHQS